MLVLLTGPVRSGKSEQGLRLALSSPGPVVVAVGGRDDDEEMARRIECHRASRPAGMSVVETTEGWREKVPAGACLLVDCLGTVLGRQLWDLVGTDTDVFSVEAEQRAEQVAGELVEWLIARTGDTVVVSNEVGWGVVPATPAGRLFRDVLGRANRRLAEAADAAWLVVNGRCLEISNLQREVSWPKA